MRGLWQACHGKKITPPNGFNCRCTTIALTETQAIQRGWKGFTEYRDKGEPDTGWDYNPADSQDERPEKIKAERLAKASPAVAQAAKDNTYVNQFTQWAENPSGNFQIAKLPGWIAAALSATSESASLSEQSFKKNKLHHPDVEISDYLKIPGLLESAISVIKDGNRSIVVIEQDVALWLLALKAAQTGKAVFVTSFRKTNEQDKARKMRQGIEIKK